MDRAGLQGSSVWLVVVCALGCAQLVTPTPSVDAGGDMESVDDAGSVCAAPRVLCGGACVGLQTDRAHCGRCGNVCAPGQWCSGGACTSATMAMQRSCEGTPMPPGCGMLAIAGGSFEMGASSTCPTPPMPPSGNCANGYHQLPERVTVSGFVLDTHEVSVGRFRRFWLERSGSAAPSVLRARPVAYRGGQSIGWRDAAQEPRGPEAYCNWDASGALDAHPLNCVDWWAAQEFCVWDGYGRGRLPTEAEWEYAARGRTDGGLPSGRYYPWGNTEPSLTCDRAHWYRCAGHDGRPTRRVGSFVATAGLFDMAGNLWEWTADRYARPPCRTGLSDPLCNEIAGLATVRVVRGGTWNNYGAASLRSASRFYGTPANRDYYDVGFRCARDTP